jgi:hypothetical protein
MFHFFKKPPYFFPKWLNQLSFLPAVYKGSFPHLTSSPTFVGGDVFDDSYSNRSEVEFYCGFDLHFLYGQGW